MVRKKQSDSSIRVGVDTGGTFTDFVYYFKNRLHLLKLASTPNDPSEAIARGLRQIAAIVGCNTDAIEVTHGTTVGTNALLQRRGARVALITTRGFEDVLVIGRQARPELYNLDVERKPPLVTDELRLGADERVTSTGEVLVSLTDTELDRLVVTLKKLKPEAIAISLLFSFVDPQHEQRIGAALANLAIPISVSHRILPEYREYERTSTVVVNAYLQPLMGSYLRRLQQHVSQLRVMQSSGGIISAPAAADEPVRTILSGPAGGVVGSIRAAHKFKNLITFDMGGTSTDVALVDGEGIRTTREAIVADMPIAVSMMDIHTVGAGGGSIARVDDGGSLRVGPESAGADPGPAAYGKSSLPTVTDAHVVLGHFGGRGLLGGEFQLDIDKANKAMQVLATEMSRVVKRQLSITAAAQGVLSVVNTNMERALRHISVERGFDPRDFVLVPFGGAGGLHAVELARALQIPFVLVPASPGALSALGVLTADVVKDQTRTVMLAAGKHNEKTLARIFREIESEARAVLAAEGFSKTQQRHRRSIAARYRGQSFELELITSTSDIARQFHHAHQKRYGYAEKANEVEIVSARVRSTGLVQPVRAAVLRKARSTRRPPKIEVVATMDGKRQRVSVYEREVLEAGVRIPGPSIIREYSATTLLPSGSIAIVDQSGSLLVTA